MNVRKWFTVSGVVLLLMLLLAVGLTQAQGPGPDGVLSGNPGAPARAGVSAVVPGTIPIQGRLADSAGNPLNGVYTFTFSLYEQNTGGAPLCSDSQALSVKDGLFEFSMGYCWDDLSGQRVYLGVKVGSDAEMTPRQIINPVPYALSLRPGAVISNSQTGAILTIRNPDSGSALQLASNTGSSLSAVNTSADSEAVYAMNYEGDAIKGLSLSTTGVVGAGATGVEGVGLTDAAFLASGTGVIQSVANSYVWISGNGLQKRASADSTQFEMDSYGGVLVTRGVDAGAKDVILPVTLPGQLYGQDVTISRIDVYFKSETDFDGIGITAVRRQSGAGSGDLIIRNVEDRVCQTACSYYLTLSDNNVLDENHGIVYVALQLFFSSDTSYVQIGGVRLTLEHD